MIVRIAISPSPTCGSISSTSLSRYDASCGSKVCKNLYMTGPNLAWPNFFVGAARGALHTGRALILPDISHELRLQPLCAQLSANVQSPFPHRNFVIPRAEVEHGPVELKEGRPHQPPAVGRSLERPAVGAGATVKQIGSRCGRFYSCHPQLPGSKTISAKHSSGSEGAIADYAYL